MATTTQLVEAHGVDIVTDQDFDLDVPVLSGTMRQGDVLLLPADVTATAAVPVTGTVVVRSEASANTHAIFAADGPVFCDTLAASTTDLRVALLSVPEGSTAYLAHPEHGFMGVATGTYEIRRQREQAEQMRVVAD